MKATDSASGQTFTWSAAQLLGDPGFESGGTSSPWTTTSTVGGASTPWNNSSSEPRHSGSWDLWLNGWGQADTDTLAQTVTIPAGCVNATLTFWLHIDTAETTTTTRR